MTRYSNGRVPASVLVKRGVHRLPAGTWAKWDALVADVKTRYGKTLTITSSAGNPGSGSYRDIAMQQAMKRKHGSGAAAPGTSSHGGTFKGRDAMAIDVSNYGVISLSNFYAAARRAGFDAGYFDGKGKPYEPWHLIDYDPYRTIPKPKPTPAPEPGQIEEEEEDMNAGFYYTRAKDGAIVYLLVNFNSGIYHEYTDGRKGVPITGSYNNPVAATMRTGSFAKITEGHARAVKAACDKEDRVVATVKQA